LPQADENPVWNGWDVLWITALTLIAMLVSQFAVVVAAQWFVYPRASLADVAQKPIVLLASQLPVYIVVAAFMIALVEGKYRTPFWRAVRWNWPRRPWALLALALGAVMFVVLSLLQFVLPMPKNTPFEQLFDRPRDAYLISLLAVTVGPLMEELFFRGFLYPVLARWIGAVWGVLLSALPFGLIHYLQYRSWAVVFIITIVGVVCGAVRATTKSVGASFLVHVGYNGVEMFLLMLATHGFRHMGNAAAFNRFWQ